MDFGIALRRLKAGTPICREGWNGRNMYIYYYKMDGMLPCVVLHNALGKEQPGWVCSQEDMLADDWQVYKGAEDERISA